MPIEPVPSNPFGWMIWMLALAFGVMYSLFVPVTSSVEPVQPVIAVTASAPDAATSGVRHMIDSVEVLQPEPGKVVLSVTGYQPDGCDMQVDYAQMRADNYIYVFISRDLPADSVCPAMAMQYAAEVTIEGEIEPGLYTFVVNGFTIEKEIK